MNAASVLVLLAVLAGLALAVRGALRGKGRCAGGCEGCPGCRNEKK